jgi:alpha-N-arabinofuranosidase
MKRPLLTLAAIVCFVLHVSAADPMTIRVRDKTLHTIDPRLFGQFLERPSWHHEIGPEGALVPGTNRLQPKVVEMLQRMKPPVLRFPGGTDVDHMDWRDMIDNVPGREGGRPVSTGHKGDKVTNRFGIDEFLAVAERLDTDPLLVVNFRNALLDVKPLDEAARDAAGLVAYCNATVGAELPEGLPDWPAIRAKNGRRDPWKVKYWQIGNETWFFFRKLKKLAGDEAADRYAERLVAVARAMLAVDPDIVFVIDAHGPTLAPALKARKALGDKVCWMAFHIYEPWGIKKVLRGGEPVPIDTLSPEAVWNAWVATPGFDDDGRAVVRHPLIGRARREGLKLAVTEWNWNGWWNAKGAPLDASLAKGVGAAGFLHGLMRSGDVIEMGCQSMLVGNSWGITAIRADREGRRPPVFYPTGQVTMLYSNHHGSKRLALEEENVPTYTQPLKMNAIAPRKKIVVVDALATADDDTVYLHLINRRFDGPTPVAIDLSDLKLPAGKARRYSLEGRLTDKTAEGERAQIAEIVTATIAHDGKRLTVALPKRSVSVIEIER